MQGWTWALVLLILLGLVNAKRENEERHGEDAKNGGEERGNGEMVRKELKFDGFGGGEASPMAEDQREETHAQEEHLEAQEKLEISEELLASLRINEIVISEDAIGSFFIHKRKEDTKPEDQHDESSADPRDKESTSYSKLERLSEEPLSHLNSTANEPPFDSEKFKRALEDTVALFSDDGLREYSPSSTDTVGVVCYDFLNGSYFDLTKLSSST